MLLDCAGRVCSLDGCDAERPDLVDRRLFRAPARRAGRLFLFLDVMTDRARFLGELHFSFLMTLAVGNGWGESYEEPRVVMDA